MLYSIILKQIKLFENVTILFYTHTNTHTHTHTHTHTYIHTRASKFKQVNHIKLQLVNLQVVLNSDYVYLHFKHVNVLAYAIKLCQILL